jgi:hypothetical protein
VTEQTEVKKIASLARQYAADGYQVYAHAPGFSVPEAIRGYTPDLVLKKDNETIIIEVKTTSMSLNKQKAIEEIARYAAETNGVRFDLVVTNPKKKRLESRLNQLGALRENLWHTLESAIRLEQYKVFCTVAAIVLEDILVGAAARRSWSEWPAQRELPKIADALCQNKIISESVSSFAHEVWKLRNAAVHGSAIEIDRTECNQVFTKLSRLADDYGWRERVSPRG